MQSVPLNWLAILVVTIVRFVLGFVWFGLIFGKQWQGLTGVSQDAMKKGMARAIATDLITTFIMAWVLAHALFFASKFYGAMTWQSGAIGGFFNWLGFIGAVSLAAQTYEQKPIKLWIIVNAYQLISLVIMGAILAAWQ
jgi:hypothetical protein